MKKIFAAAVVALAGLAAFAAEGWENNLCFGLGLPQMDEKMDSDPGNDGKFTSSGASFIFKDMIVKKNNNLVLIIDAEIGELSTKDITDEKEYMVFGSINFGAGYALVKTDKALVVLGGLIGIDELSFKDTVRYLGMDGYVTEDYEVSATLFNIGADFFATYRFTPKVGIFADMKVLYNTGSTEIKHTIKPNSWRDKYSTEGTLITPAFGVVIRF